MDDLTITTQTHVQARWVLSALESTTSWARMKFKPKKSRSLIIKKASQPRSSTSRYREKTFHLSWIVQSSAWASGMMPASTIQIM